MLPHGWEMTTAPPLPPTAMEGTAKRPSQPSAPSHSSMPQAPATVVDPEGTRDASPVAAPFFLCLCFYTLDTSEVLWLALEYFLPLPLPGQQRGRAWPQHREGHSCLLTILHGRTGLSQTSLQYILTRREGKCGN